MLLQRGSGPAPLTLNPKEFFYLRTICCSAAKGPTEGRDKRAPPVDVFLRGPPWACAWLQQQIEGAPRRSREMEEQLKDAHKRIEKTKRETDNKPERLGGPVGGYPGGPPAVSSHRRAARERPTGRESHRRLLFI